MTHIITGVIGAIIGAICSGWIAWMIAKRNTERTILASLGLIRIQVRDKAAASFRLEFLELILFLKCDIEPERKIADFPSYLVTMYPKHAAAIITFTPYLGKTDIKRIDRAWFNYCFPCGIKKGTEEEGKKEFPLGDYVHMGEEKAKRIALENIEKLLSISGHIKTC